MNRGADPGFSMLDHYLSSRDKIRARIVRLERVTYGQAIFIEYVLAHMRLIHELIFITHTRTQPTNKKLLQTKRPS